MGGLLGRDPAGDVVVEVPAPYWPYLVGLGEDGADHNPAEPDSGTAPRNQAVGWAARVSKDVSNSDNPASRVQRVGNCQKPSWEA